MRIYDRSPIRHRDVAAASGALKSRMTDSGRILPFFRSRNRGTRFHDGLRS
jgi:hypothetical protein